MAGAGFFATFTAMLFTKPRAAALLILSVVLVYANGLDGPFVFDDHYNIRENPAIRSLWPLSSALNPPPAHMSFCTRPLLNLSMCVDHALWGLNPRGYHLSNVTLHLLAVLAFFFALGRTLASCGRSKNEALGLSFAAALLWAVHPLNTAAVNYLSQRGELLVGLFLFLMLYALDRAATAASPPRAARWHIAAFFACLLGMGSKETMAAAPVLALVYDRIFLSASWKEVFSRRGLLYLLLSLTWLWPLSRHLLFSPHAREGVLTAEIFWSCLLIQAKGLPHLFRLMVWPAPLVFDYGCDLTVHLSDVWLPAAALALLAAAAAWGAYRNPRAGFGVLFFFALLAPGVLFPVVGQPLAEHRLYVPLAAAISLAVAGLGPRLNALLRSRRATVLVLSLMALALGACTARRNADYRSDIMLMSDTINKRPDNERAWYNRGLAFQRLGRLDAALADYDEALRLRADYVHPLINRAFIHFERQDDEAALADMNRVLAASPDWPEMLFRRAQIHLRRSAFRDAAADLGRAVVLQPWQSAWMNDYAWVLATAPDDGVRDGRRALAWAGRAVKLSGGHYRSLDILAAAQAAAGRYEEARATAAKALAQARQRNDPAAAARIEERLRCYREGRAWSP